jgi:hypothetical protein
MADLNGFNANEVEPSASFEAIPAGKYLAMVTDSEMKPTKNGSGSYLQLTLTILEGEHKGRIVWARLNLVNPNQTAVRIAQSELSAVCRALGVMTPKDSVELHNIPLLITVKVKNRDDTGELTNEVKGYEHKAAATGHPQQVPVSDTTPPWKR